MPGWGIQRSGLCSHPLLLLPAASVVSDPVQLHRRQPTRLPRPRDSPGNNTGVGCHFLLQQTHWVDYTFHRPWILKWHKLSIRVSIICVILKQTLEEMAKKQVALVCLNIRPARVTDHFSCVQLMRCYRPYAAHQTSLSKGFSRQEYWSGLPCHLNFSY